jgi:putative ABC transport system permease protein
MGSTAVDRLAALNGVDAAGPLVGYATVTISRGIHSRDLSAEIPLNAVSPGSLDVIERTVTSGRTFDAGHFERGEPVILLSDSAARQLQITRTGTAVFIQNQAFTVTGIYDDVQRQPDTLGAALIPTTATSGLNLGIQHLSVVIETVPGAAQQIGAQAALALQPNAPEALTVNAPPDPQTLRREVEGSVTKMSLLASLIALIAGSVSIGNSATATMVQRIPEIGLRRALGARRSSIFAQLLGETTFLGMLGGAAGALLGVTATIGVALVNGWVPLIETTVVAVAIGAGCAAGSVAGFLPALRATRISPTEALSR